MNAVLKRRWLVVAASLLVGAAAHAQTPPKVGDKIVMPEVLMLDGTRLAPADFTGKPLIVQYWASWCPYCARQNPHLQKLRQAASAQDLPILAISIDKEEKDAQDYIAKRGYTFGAAMDTEALRAVFGKRRVIPEVFVIDRQGRIAQIIPGEMFEEDMLELVRYATPRP